MFPNPTARALSLALALIIILLFFLCSVAEAAAAAAAACESSICPSKKAAYRKDSAWQQSVDSISVRVLELDCGALPGKGVLNHFF